MKFLLRYLRDRLAEILFFLLCILIFAGVLLLYGIPGQAAIYPALLCGLLGAGALTADFLRVRSKHLLLQRFQKLPDQMSEGLQRYSGICDADYREIIMLLTEQQMQSTVQSTRKMEDMMDYYTTWVHQIKTPIASMRLKLQNEDSALSRSLTVDLFRIEQYVEMVLCYLRLDSEGGDFVFAEYSLDEILKGAVRKFARQFIGKGLHLELSETGKTVLTDEKWLSFVVEQVLSNALKYTPAGEISLSVEDPMTLCIRDTGIGIAPEDLPRVFDRGYTGINGRLDHRASGLGLYLCKRICTNLGIAITVESEVGQGTVIRLDLARKQLRHE